MDKIKELGEVENLLIKKEFEYMNSIGTNTDGMGSQKIYKNDSGGLTFVNNYGFDIVVCFDYSKDLNVRNKLTGVAAIVKSVKLSNENEPVLTKKGIKSFVITETPDGDAVIKSLLNTEKKTVSKVFKI